MFKEATNEMAFLKYGAFGSQGSGKTLTSSLIAIGLHKYIKSKKPVCFIDTETGSSFVLPRFKEAKIQLMVSKTRNFADLLDTMDEAEKMSDILIIDSISHFWRELMSAYKAKKGKAFLRIQDFAPLKDEWRGFSDRYVNGKIHTLMNGRAANIFMDAEDDDDDDGGKKKWKAVKVGTKMSAEGETGYEPSLLVEMGKIYTQEGGSYVRRAYVIKDRFDVLDSKEFDNPTFDDFLPHIKLLNIGGEHMGVETTGNSQRLFGDGGKGISEMYRQQKKYTEEIEGDLVSAFPGQSKEEKKAKVDVLQVALGTRSWAAICELHPDKLKAGRLVVVHLCEEILKNADNLHELMGPGFVDWLEAKKLGFRLGDDDIPTSWPTTPTQEKLV